MKIVATLIAVTLAACSTEEPQPNDNTSAKEKPSQTKEEKAREGLPSWVTHTCPMTHWNWAAPSLRIAAQGKGPQWVGVHCTNHNVEWYNEGTGLTAVVTPNGTWNLGEM